MTTTTIVPFGKYKGQPVETLAQDRAYCDWLAGQDWFRTRYTTMHTLIVNNFAEPHETPEHNALQVLFTDDRWTERFVWAYLGLHWWAEHLGHHVTQTQREGNDLAAQKEKRLAVQEKVLVRDRERTEAAPMSPCAIESLARQTAFVEREQASLDELRDKLRRRVNWLNSGLVPHLKGCDVTYEQEGADVELRALVACRDNHELKKLSTDGLFLQAPGAAVFVRVECKPSLGDEFPAVLRQMIAHRSTVLLIGHGGYQGIGATYEQVQKIFGASSIRIMLVSDLQGSAL